jgi:dCTP deaminase
MTVLPDHEIESLANAGAITSERPFTEGQIQPASLDLRLSDVAYRLRASFLPGQGGSVGKRLSDGGLVLHRIDLSEGHVLEQGCVYLIPLMETLKLPAGISAAGNPKSSTGRIDVFVRIITDRSAAFDAVADGYEGPLYAEVAPRSFPILARAGDALCQMRFRRGEAATPRVLDLTVDLSPSLTPDGIVGYRARRHTHLIDLRKIGGHDPHRFWEPLKAEDGRLILDPGEFYILASAEPVIIGEDEAAEMAPQVVDMGEFRAHYAGFFDPGFGTQTAGGVGGRGVLEVRGRDIPFILEHGQRAARLLYEPLSARPKRLYGQTGTNNYIGQRLKLSKHFAAWEG